MRKYIDKQKWLESLKDTALYSDTDLDEYIETAPTVTQAELESPACNRGARAFAEKLKNKIIQRYGRASLTEQYVAMQVDEWIDELLKEMGCKNEK